MISSHSMLPALFAAAFSGLILPHEEKSFLSFMREHGHVYTGSEYHFRLGIYLLNSRYVRSFNRAAHSFTVSLNKFSCFTPSEYRVLLGSRGSAPVHSSLPPTASVDPPASYDWRNVKVVQGIKDQGQCGSCWAFATIGAQESQWAIQNGQLLNLSEQNLVDCVTTSSGCNGGDKAGAIEYVISQQSGQFNSEIDYPYTASDGACRFKASAGITKVTGYVQTAANDEEALRVGVYNYGPTAVSIDASPTGFQLYTGGVYDDPGCSSTSHDHVVLVVGFGAEGGKDFWIVKNSWGYNWGENGYIRMSRNKGNQCCIACTCVIPTVK